jgi:uncharacterized membrane protein
MKISKRHLLKSITWRIVGTLDTFILSFLITGNLSLSINLSGITTITKIVWYYMHERIWFNSSITDSNKRHIFKTFTWRGIGTLDTMLFGWFLTSNPLVSVNIGLLETISKMILYFFHEKLWYQLGYGLDKKTNN